MPTISGGDVVPALPSGAAYLLAQQGGEAAAEFQKIIDHRGIMLNFPLGALAHVGLARAHVLQGDSAKARAAYQDFLTLWKDADPRRSHPAAGQGGIREIEVSWPLLDIHDAA